MKHIILWLVLTNCGAGQWKPLFPQGPYTVTLSPKYETCYGTVESAEARWLLRATPKTYLLKSQGMVMHGKEVDDEVVHYSVRHSRLNARGCTETVEEKIDMYGADGGIHGVYSAYYENSCEGTCGMIFSFSGRKK